MDTPLQHIAIIPDGNRRWARKRGLPTLEGHRRGMNKGKELVAWAGKRGIRYVSAWAFSTENWNRSAEEVSYLMNLFLEAFVREVDAYHAQGVRMRVIGRREGLSPTLQKGIKDTQRKTDANTGVQFNIFLNYGGHAEIVEAARKLVAEGCKPDDVTEETFAAALWTAEIPPPDLIIRTGGEQRLSGFMSWPSAYSELLFLEKFFPDLEEADLDAALEEYHSRERRFGK